MSIFLSNSTVALIRDKPLYNQEAPFHPSERFPEWPDSPLSTRDNPAYRAIRGLFALLRYDYENLNTPAWNPLSHLIQTGNTVFIKPNFVHHKNLGEKAYGLTDTNSLITHGSVIRGVLDYAGRALKGRGKIIIGDCPIQGASWDNLVDLAGLEKIEEYFKFTFPGIELLIKDYRLGKAIRKGRIVERIDHHGDLSDYVEIDLRKHSYLLPLIVNGTTFGVAQYSHRRMRPAHTPETNKYLVPKDLLYADAVINLPKMKSHMKAGITCAMKNFVGIVGHKDYLPHFRFGSPNRGGDEYPDENWLWDLMWSFNHAEWERDQGMSKKLLGLAGWLVWLALRFTGYPKNYQSVSAGGWYGNDTLWRTVLDINRAFFYYDRKNGDITPDVYADINYLTILDGLIGGHRECPLSPTPIESGLMLAAENPLAMDSVAAAMMGFDINKVKQISHGFSERDLPLANFGPADIVIRSDLPINNIEDVYQQKVYIPFEPSVGYKDHIEYRE